MKILRRALLLASSAVALLSSCGRSPSAVGSGEAASFLFSGNGSECTSDRSVEWQYRPANALNDRVHDTAKAYLDRYVPSQSRHECTDLVQAALRDAGALQSYNNPGGAVRPTPGSGDYQWGAFVASMTSSSGVVPAGVTPGDVVQFRNTQFSYTWRTSPTSTRTTRPTAEHHSAVVTSVSRDRRHLCVFEQNPDTVHYGWYPVTGMTAGTMWFYRPVSR